LASGGKVEKLIGRGGDFPLTVQVSPQGASVHVFKDNALVAGSELAGGGISLKAKHALYVVEASAPGFALLRHEFMADGDLKTLSIFLAREGSPLVYPARDGMAHPCIGFPWEVPDMRISMIPISSGKLPPKSFAATKVIRHPFWMADAEIGQWTYEKIMRENPSMFRDDREAPVGRLPIGKAMEFCKRLNEIERQAGRLPDGFIYRLPTEAEWEYCARAGSSGLYCFGNDVETLAKYGWFAGNSEERTHSKASLKPNAWGLYDMHGNVWEYCSDIVKRPNPDDRSQQLFFYLAKGGAYDSQAGDLGFASRRIVRAIDKKEPGIGFRIVLAPPMESYILDETDKGPLR
jgi:hypothetical protein